MAARCMARPRLVKGMLPVPFILMDIHHNQELYKINVVPGVSL
jgi:hypothetical protein